MSLLLALTGSGPITVPVSGVEADGQTGTSYQLVNKVCGKAVALGVIGTVTITGANTLETQYQFGAYGRDKIIGKPKRVSGKSNTIIVASGNVPTYALPSVAEVGDVAITCSSAITIGGISKRAFAGIALMRAESSIEMRGVASKMAVGGKPKISKIDNPRDEDIISILEELWI